MLVALFHRLFQLSDGTFYLFSCMIANPLQKGKDVARDDLLQKIYLVGKSQHGLAAGLDTTLDKLAGDGVNYSIKDFKVCFQKVEKWLKNSKASQLNEYDSNALYNTSTRLLQEPSKKEVKELAKPFDKSGIWKKLTGFLGEDKAKELYDSYQK